MNLQSNALKGLEDVYEAAMNEERYLDAVELYRSMIACGLELDEKLNDIYMLEVLKEIEDGEETPALALFQNRIITWVNAVISLRRC